MKLLLSNLIPPQRSLPILTTAMCAQRTSEWPGFSTWTKFQAEPGPIYEFIFDPLYTWSDSIRTPTYGRITESPQDCILSLDWDSPEAYQEFKASPEYQQLMDSLGINSTQAHTQIIIFENHNFGCTSTPNTEILTAYWPLSLSPEIQDAVWEAKPSLLRAAPGVWMGQRARDLERRQGSGKRVVTRLEERGARG